MVLQDIGEVIDSYSGRRRAVLEYSVVIKRLVDEAKCPGFSIETWKPLADLVAVDVFERVGPFKDVMNWNEYMKFLANWAASSEWGCSFRRITEVSDLVFLELEERNKLGDFTNVVNSLSVYEFTDAGKIRHIDLYLQMELPQGDMLKSIEDANTSE
ncbi:hypothetical protein MMAN_21130 [Mycobacterium mantenii]|uniref:SnoaL-like domain-containing protein n=1 Tax=Mycobacterium mantenii TaxID=560555 RepID=A0A1X0F7L7_MYCNT|nr:hypothetical protein [Mycobacterium mantenii]MCV7246152.1 hypothetical protein [Mycobacterium mantenii]ORA97822.1 hypothetical protein BST30_26600 [Mycobacterium mantenii]BBY37979.1 hypothetical protein MMAN_21130 [Mycobacterium mantenii]